MPGGTVYLLHLQRPYASQSGQRRRRLQHVLGYARMPLDEHLALQRAGKRARGLIKAILAQGIEWEIADTWECETEAALGATIGKLRRLGQHRLVCSICNPGNRRGTGSKWPAREEGKAE